MYPAPIEEYVRPGSIDDALAALKRYSDGEAMFIAGGQSLMQAIKARIVQPKCVIDLQAIAELEGITAGGDGVEIGAMTRYVDIARDERLAPAYQALNDGAAHVGDRQVRNRGTIGGSVCWNYLAACFPCVTLGLGATMNLMDAGGAKRSLSADEFLGAPLETARRDDEILVSLSLPASTAKAGSAYKKWALLTDGLPVIGVCVMAQMDDAGACQDARVAVGGLASGPRRSGAAEVALQGCKAGDGDGIAAAMDAAADEIDTQSDLWADADYRKHLIRSLGTDVASTALSRAAG